MGVGVILVPKGVANACDEIDDSWIKDVDILELPFLARSSYGVLEPERLLRLGFHVGFIRPEPRVVSRLLRLGVE